MEKLRLTARELICLAAIMGVSEIFGIPNGFRGVAPRALAGEISRTQQSLERKGVLEMDFDGNTVLHYRQLFETMFGCDGFLAVDRQLASDGQDGFLIYRLDGRFVEAQIEGELYILSELSSPDLAVCVPWRTDGTELKGAARAVSQRVMEKVRDLTRRGERQAAEAALNEHGVAEGTAQIVLKAFALESDYYSFAFAELGAAQSFRSIMFVDDAGGTVEIRPVVVNDVSHVEIAPVSRRELAQRLGEAMERFCRPGEV